jgi:hypothetical protein
MVSPRLEGERLAPVRFDFYAEEVLVRANAIFRKERLPDLWSSVAAKIDELRRYDVLATDTVVAVLSEIDSSGDLELYEQMIREGELLLEN